jgi:hypothetical protein
LSKKAVEEHHPTLINTPKKQQQWLKRKRIKKGENRKENKGNVWRTTN